MQITKRLIKSPGFILVARAGLGDNSIAAQLQYAHFGNVQGCPDKSDYWVGPNPLPSRADLPSSRHGILLPTFVGSSHQLKRDSTNTPRLGHHCASKLLRFLSFRLVWRIAPFHVISGRSSREGEKSRLASLHPAYVSSSTGPDNPRKCLGWSVGTIQD